MPEPLRIERDGPVARLVIDRPAKRNALTAAMWGALPGMIAEIVAAAEVKVAVICGAGPDFGTGADIAEFAEIYATPATIATYAGTLGAAISAIADCPKPVIAQIEGACIGGGCNLALACDLRIGSSNARFAITPGKLGLAYSLSDTRRLCAAIGPSQARFLLYTGRMIGGDEALRIGLLDQLVEAESLRDTVQSLALEIAAGSSTSIRITKATLGLIAAGVQADTEETRRWFADAAAGPDMAEGLAAFLEKRKPVFS